MNVYGHSIIVATRDQLSAATDAQTIIAGLRRGNYYGVRGVGARVWELVQSPIAAADVQRAIADEYDVRRERSDADVLALLMRMADERLIEVCDG